MIAPERRTVTLADGRVLSYLELGDPQGLPVLFTVGTPSSAVGARAYAPGAARNGLKLLALDKPGYGLSTRDARHTLKRFGDDVVELADHLGLASGAVAGQSGGGPHALAVAHALGTRASTLTLLGTYGPAALPWARSELPMFTRTMAWTANHAPGLLAVPVAGLRAAFRNPERFERMSRKQAHKLSESDRATMALPESKYLTTGVTDAFAHGSAAVRDEWYAINRPWGFAPGDVTVDTHLWHGTADQSCPIAIARTLAQHLPNATLHELPGVGHVFLGTELDEAMTTLRAHANG